MSAAPVAGIEQGSSLANSKRKKRGLLPVVIMGAGRLGESLLTLGSFSLSGFTIVGVFDKDPKRIGLKFVSSSCGTHVVEPTVELASRVHSYNVKRGIIAVPSNTAQEAADELIGAGINVILSYAPTDVKVPKDVIFSRVDPATQFARMVPPSRFPWHVSRPHERSYQHGKLAPKSEFASVGLARQPSMWASFDGPVSLVINPVLLTLVSSSSAASYDEDADCNDEEETSTITTNVSSEEEVQDSVGFFEFIQSNQRFFLSQQKASPVILDSKHGLVGLEPQFESVKESLLLSDDLVRIRGTLLYGPSGCGKSTLLKHLAINMPEVAFFYASGEEESLISAFRSAGKITSNGSPAAVVVENIDVVCRKRSYKSTFLSCVDSPTFNKVSILASSNAPWDLDTSVLRHFERRTEISLPTSETRAKVLKKHFNGCTISEKLSYSDFIFTAREMEGYSTSDVIAVAKNAGLQALKSGEPLCRQDLIRSAKMIRPTFCKEMLPLFQSFSQRFGTHNVSNQVAQDPAGTTYLSMYS